MSCTFWRNHDETVFIIITDGPHMFMCLCFTTPTHPPPPPIPPPPPFFFFFFNTYFWSRFTLHWRSRCSKFDVCCLVNSLELWMWGSHLIIYLLIWTFFPWNNCTLEVIWCFDQEPELLCQVIIILFLKIIIIIIVVVAIWHFDL